MDKPFSLKNWVECWDKADQVMSQLKQKEIDECDISESIRSFNLAFKCAISNEPLIPYSGLIEQQKLFLRLRHD